LSSPGVFITFEGIDGSGKTTQLARARDWLAGGGLEVVVAQEPGGTRIGSEIRRILLDAANKELRPVPELLLYFASRAQNIEEVIRPALEAGKVVLSDRFTDATLAYQGYGRELGAEAVRAVEQVACGGLRPDLTLFLDLAPAAAVPRALRRNAGGGADESRMEREDRAFYQRVYEGYLSIAREEPRRFRRVEASGEVEQVATRVEQILDDFLRERGLRPRKPSEK